LGVKRCKNGHIFDGDKYTLCPHCPVIEEKETKGPIFKFEKNASMEKTRVLEEADIKPINVDDDEKTIYFRPEGLKKAKADPVVGWLVCIEGPNIGQDYRLHSERNFIGRSAEMDVNIDLDNHVSRGIHAVISYNPENGKFRFAAGETRGIVYVNGREVDSALELTPGDKIKVGDTVLEFVPFCHKGFNWK